MIDLTPITALGAATPADQRFGALRDDMDIFRTFEGDNTVLRLLVAKNQMSRLAHKFGRASGLRKIGAMASMKLRGLFGRLGAPSGRTDAAHFLDPAFQNKVFAQRERSMMYALSDKYVKIMKAENAGQKRCNERSSSMAAENAARSAAASSPTSPGRPLAEIMRTPRFILAVAAGVVSYGLMSFVMTAAPMAMVGCGFTVGEAAFGIQWHVLAMFAPSFVTGNLIARYGKERITALGLVLIAASGAVALGGLDIENFFVSLILLGVGITTQIAQVCLTEGLGRTPAGYATAVGYIQIAFAMLWSATIFGVFPDFLAIGGALLVFVGIAILVVTRPRTPT